MLTRKEWKSIVRALLLAGLGSAVTAFGIWSRGPTVAVSAEAGQNQAAAPRTQVTPPQNRPAQNPNTVYTNYEPVDGKGGEEVSGPYQVVKGWPQPVTAGWTINAETMYAES